MQPVSGQRTPLENLLLRVVKLEAAVAALERQVFWPYEPEPYNDEHEETPHR